MLTAGKASWRSTDSSECQAIGKRAPLRETVEAMLTYVNVPRDNGYSATISRVIVNSHRGVSRRIYAALGADGTRERNERAGYSSRRIWLIAV